MENKIFFVIESDIEWCIARPGDIVTDNQLSVLVHECGFVMVTAFTNKDDALDYASYLRKKITHNNKH